MSQHRGSKNFDYGYKQNVEYTFFCCSVHNQGWCVQGNPNCLPEGFNYCNSVDCTSADWAKNGVLDGNYDHIIVCQPVTTKFDGDFKFEYLRHSIVDTNGARVTVPTDVALYKWFDYFEWEAKYKPERHPTTREDGSFPLIVYHSLDMIYD